MLHTNHKAIAQSGLEKRLLKDFFYLIWVWRQSVSYDLDRFYKFTFIAPKSFRMQILFQMTQKVLRKTRFNVEIWVTFGQGRIMTGTLDTNIASFTHLVECIYPL